MISEVGEPSSRPVFDFRTLMDRVGAPTAGAMADICSLNRKGVHNRLVRGISWAEADELAVRCGFMPWEVWPAWDLVDPSAWIQPLCPTHGNDHVEELDDFSQRCRACETAPAAIAA